MTANGERSSELVREFAEYAERWDSLVASSANRANVVFDRAHEVAKQLRLTGDGRAGIERLTRHPLPGVRLLAASECLAWAPDIATPVLEELERGPTLHAVSAKYTLKEYRSGTLNLDW